MEHRPWWEEIKLCKGITKKGKHCRNYARRPFTNEQGELIIPLTCWRHADQEFEIRKKLEIKIKEVLENERKE